MPSNIVVNKMSTQHKASIGMASAFPDVCKTPAPPAPAPVPIPYPNIAMSAMASLKTSKKVKDNKQKVMVKGSAYSMSNGDQPGVAMGVVSNKIMGKSYIKNQSFNVKFEKKGVGRLADPHGNNCGSDPPNTVAPAQAQPPMMGMAGPDAEAQKAACERLKSCHIDEEDRDDWAEYCGMLPEHAEGIRAGCGRTQRSVTFRSTNRSSSKHIKNNLPAKGTDIKEKTISGKTIPTAHPKHQSKISDLGLDGLVGAYDDKDRLVGVKTTKGHIPFDEISECPPPPKNVYTGDYDAHDMFGADGGRIRDGTKQEDNFRRSLNRDAGRGMSKKRSMIRHGPQNNYSDYVKNNKLGKPHPIRSLQLPDVSSKEPLLCFDGNGEMYVFETEDQLKDYYTCKGQEIPSTWKHPERTKIESEIARKKATRWDHIGARN